MFLGTYRVEASPGTPVFIFTTCETEGRCVKLTSLTDRSDEVHRCQGELEQEGEEFMEACAAWPNIGCQEIDIQGKPYNLCCCNDRHWCNAGRQLYLPVSFVLLAALISRMI